MVITKLYKTCVGAVQAQELAACGVTVHFDCPISEGLHHGHHLEFFLFYFFNSGGAMWKELQNLIKDKGIKYFKLKEGLIIKPSKF